MKSIGGYFELELGLSGQYYPDAITLNTARNAFEYVLKVRRYKKVYIPYFTCEVMLEPVKKLKVDYELYHINQNLEPVFDYDKIKSDEGFLYTNYFGLKDKFICNLGIKVSNLIIDNAQSFFSEPINNVDTFYSPRKFFGVSDGAYLFCNKILDELLEQDASYDRMSHLLIRADENAEAGYSEFNSNDTSLVNQPVKKMSKITNKILGSIDYNQVKTKRIQNFEYLHQHLKSFTKLKWDINAAAVPMVYPLWTAKENIREKLIEQKIYTAKYWPSVLNFVDSDSLEHKLVNEIVCLPVDQRYSEVEMNKIIKLIIG